MNLEQKNSSIKDNGQRMRNLTYLNNWLSAYNKLVDYKKENGHCNIAARESYKDINLGTWAVNQRTKKQKLSNDQIEKLNKLNFDWDPKETLWQSMYLQLTKYHNEYGHSNVPKGFKENKSLGEWVFTQRIKKKSNKLSSERIKLLKSLNFVWLRNRDSWENNLKLLKRFNKKNKHFTVPSNKNHISLYNWLSAQKRMYQKGSLKESRIIALKKIGFKFD